MKRSVRCIVIVKGESCTFCATIDEEDFTDGKVGEIVARLGKQMVKHILERLEDDE